MAYIELSGISKAFAGVQALHNINLEVNEGEIIGLAGQNGGGKSTLIKILSGFYKPDEGIIKINGKEYPHGLSPKKSISEGIQVIYQDFSLFYNLTVGENIALPFIYNENNKLYSKKKAYELAKKALSELEVEIPLDSLVSELSVANKQLVAIARSVVYNARLLIMDEPTSALTQKEVTRLLEVVKKLSSRGVAVIFVSHKMEEVTSVVKKIVIVRNGKKVIEGPIEDFDSDKITYYMTGRKIEDSRYECEADTVSTTPLFEVRNLGADRLFKDISFKLYAGEVVGIIGLLGSGRSELACALAGLIPISEGSMYRDNKEIKIQSVKQAIDNDIAYLPEDRLSEGLFLPQSIKTNIVCPIFDRFTKASLLHDDYMNECADKWIEELSIATPTREVAAEMLSGGNQQKVVLAKWIATNPKVLILNSPTAGIDVGSKHDIHTHIKHLARNGMGVILISDEIPEVLNTCNRILVMKNGRICAEHKVNNLDSAKLASEMSNMA